MPTNITFSLFILSLLEEDNFCLQYDRITDREEPQEPAILNTQKHYSYLDLI